MVSLLTPGTQKTHFVPFYTQKNYKAFSGFSFKKTKTLKSTFRKTSSLEDALTNYLKFQDHCDQNPTQILGLFSVDPLWDRVYDELYDLLGNVSVHLKNCQLGDISPYSEMVILYCESKEIADFVKIYSFLILGCLEKYFPQLKKVDVNVTEV